MVAQAQFSTTDLMVQPGDTETLQLTLINLGNRTETFTLVPAGLVAGWVRLVPPTVTLFGGTQADITVTLRPPRLASTPAGPAPLTVRVIPLDEPDEVVIAETTVIIGAFQDRRVHLLQPVVRSRRRATFEFLIENQGNTQASCRLHLIDTSQRLDGDFDPPAVGIEPGGTSLVRLRMRAVRPQWRSGSRTLPFSIEADQQGFPTATARASFVQSPIVPDKLGRRAVVVVLLAGALGGAWFGLIKPATKRAAKDAVREITPVVVSTVAGSSQQPTQTSTVESTAPATTVPRVPFFSTRLPVETDQNGTNSGFYEVPAGKQLRITDLIMQNAFADTGLATVQKNDTVLAQWDLYTAAQNNDSLQLFSALVLEPGTKLTFSVRCDAVGSPNNKGKCVEGLLISGTLIDG